jgi:hypothetical protein
MNSVVADERIDVEVDGHRRNRQRMQHLPSQIHVVLEARLIDVAVESVLLGKHPVAKHRTV